jgi:hypothetical protein
MCSLIHTSDKSKRLGYVYPNLINQIELNPQINENNLKYKNMRLKSKIAMKKNSPMTKGLLLLPTQDGPCCAGKTKHVPWPHIISSKLINLFLM